MFIQLSSCRRVSANATWNPPIKPQTATSCSSWWWRVAVVFPANGQSVQECHDETTTWRGSRSQSQKDKEGRHESSLDQFPHTCQHRAKANSILNMKMIIKSKTKKKDISYLDLVMTATVFYSLEFAKIYQFQHHKIERDKCRHQSYRYWVFSDNNSFESREFHRRQGTLSESGTLLP